MKKPVRPLSGPAYHAVRFYESDRALSRIVAEFLSDGFEAGNPGIIVATPRQRGAIVRELSARSVDVARVLRSGDLVLLDARETLATFMANGTPDAVKFQDSMCEVIRKACRGRANCTVRIYGQMVDVLWQAGKQDGAIRLEILWNQLANSHAFSLMCGYAMGHFYKDANFADICSHHTHVVSADGHAAAVA
jgi:MEDS: MEthanogen/methylotroph, DcmR Sensory domain